MVDPQELAQHVGWDISWLDAVLLGLVEGVTEFLPISSTGHLIVTNRLLGLAESPLTIGIQFGAITAILVLYWRDLWRALLRMLGRAPAAGDADPGGAAPGRQPNLLLQILIAALPAAVIGLLFDDLIEGYLFSPGFVAGTMTIGGVLLLWLERWLRNQPAAPAGELPEMSYRVAFYVGLWQCLALLPGTSRSGATIAGAMLLGLTRPAAAEISFLVGLPILYGACAVKLLDNLDAVLGPLLMPMIIASVVAFFSALVVVVPFVRFLRSHTFVPFAIYRIVAGLVLTAACLAGWL